MAHRSTGSRTNRQLAAPAAGAGPIKDLSGRSSAGAASDTATRMRTSLAIVGCLAAEPWRWTATAFRVTHMRISSLIAAASAAVFLSCSQRSVPGVASPPASVDENASSKADFCEEVDAGGRCSLWGPSMIALIANPDAYHGKRVRLIGFVNFEFEGNGLYISREDWRQAIYRNGLWVDLPGDRPASGQPNRRYVLIEGTFRADHQGHMGMWSGALERVTRLQAWGTDSTDAGR